LEDLEIADLEAQMIEVLFDEQGVQRQLVVCADQADVQNYVTGGVVWVGHASSGSASPEVCKLFFTVLLSDAAKRCDYVY
jgi:hypothetical protein